MTRSKTAASALLILSLLLIPARGFAHAILMTSQPPAGATVEGPDVPMLLHFNSRIDHARSLLTVTDADGQARTLAIAPSSAVDEIKSMATLSAGKYVLRWQVLSADGHITRGDVLFEVRTPATP